MSDAVEQAEQVEEPVVETQEVESVEAPVVESEASTSEPSPPPSLFDRFKEVAGTDYSSKYQSEEDLLKGLANAASLVGKKSEKERQFEQLVSSPQWQQYQQWAAQQSQRQPEPQPQPQGFRIPELQEGDEDFVEDDPANPGQRRISHLAPPDVRKRILERSKFVRAVQSNPQEAFGPLFESMQAQLRQDAIQHAQQFTQQQFQQWQAQQAEQQAIEQIKTTRDAMLFERNSAGQKLHDESGMPVLKPWGQAYVERVSYLGQVGITNPRMLDQLASEYADYKTQTKTPPPAPGQTRAKTVTGGQVKPGQKVNSGSLAQMILNENTHIGPEDTVTKIEFV